MDAVKTKKSLDILGRDRLLDQTLDVMHLISEKKGSYTFSLNGEWGAGKSFFLDMLEAKLRIHQAGERYLVFHYNCWQYDYYEEPLVAIVAAISDSINAQTELLSQEAVKEVLAQLKAVAKTIAFDIFKNKTGIDVDHYLSESEAQSNFDVHFEFKKAITETRTKLERLSDHQTLVIVVDELDRCLPSYAIQVLERLHHLFSDLKNCVVILAVDQNQLNHTIKQIFGEHVGTQAYLKKFVNFEIALDNGEVNQSVREKYSTYLDLFDDSLIPESNFPIDEFFSCVFNGIDIRTQERIMERIHLAHSMLFSNEKKDYSFMCFEVLWVVLSEVYQYHNSMPFIVSNRLTLRRSQTQVKQVPVPLMEHLSGYINPVSDHFQRIVATDREGYEIPQLVIWYYSRIYSGSLNVTFYIRDTCKSIVGYDQSIKQLQEFIALLSIIK